MRERVAIGPANGARIFRNSNRGQKKGTCRMLSMWKRECGRGQNITIGMVHPPLTLSVSELADWFPRLGRARDVEKTERIGTIGI